MVLPPSNKLSEAMTKPAQDGKINDVHVKICRPKCIEFVALAANIYDKEKPYSRLAFAAHAVKMIRDNYITLARVTYADYDVVITLVLLNTSDSYYTTEQRAAIKQSVEKIKQENSAFKRITIRMLIVKNLDQITQYINQGDSYRRAIYPIARVDIFAHGLVGCISLGYKLFDMIKDENGNKWQPHMKLQLNREVIMQWNPKAFSEMASFYSWACQTGVIDKKGSRNDSLAKFIAYHLKIPVYAFIKRTEYSDTWGTRGDRIILRTQCNIPLVGNTDRCEQLTEENKERNKNMKKLGATWMENGAVYPVGNGSTPEEAPDGMFIYYPNVKEPQKAPNL